MVIQKNIKQVFLENITKLEHYTINNGDYLELEVSSESPYTEWTMRFKCITEDLNCDSCLFYPGKPQKNFRTVY